MVVHVRNKMQLMFWVLQITVWPALCYEIKNVETRKIPLYLENNGELDVSTQIPNCGPSSKIFLNSYTYNRLQCSRDACNSVYEEALSQTTVYQLHQNCSLREKCENLNFPVPTSLRNLSTTEFLAVIIQYQCLGDYTILNMCEKHKRNFTDTLYLTFEYYTKNLKECRCWVNMGAFTLTIMDLRLKTRYEDTCSRAKFFINGHLYTCDLQSNSYGAKFAEKVRAGLPLGAFISLVPNLKLPEMVWLALTPEEASEIECHGISIMPEKTSNMVTVSPKQWLSTKSVAEVVDTSGNLHPSLTTSENLSTISTAPTPAQPGNNNSGFMIATIILSLLLVGVLVKFLWDKIKRCIKQQREKKNTENLCSQINKQDRNSDAIFLTNVVNENSETVQIPTFAEITPADNEQTSSITDSRPVAPVLTSRVSEITPVAAKPTSSAAEIRPINTKPTSNVAETTQFIAEPTSSIAKTTSSAAKPTTLIFTESTPWATDVTETIKQPDVETKRDSTSSEIELILSHLKQNENIQSNRSLSNKLVATAHTPDPSRPDIPTYAKALDFPEADETDPGDDIKDVYVTDGLIEAENATTDKDSESKAESNEQNPLLEGMISLKEGKKLFRK